MPIIDFCEAEYNYQGGSWPKISHLWNRLNALKKEHNYTNCVDPDETSSFAL